MPSARYNFRCYPTPEQAQLLARTFGCVRVAYNWGLERGRGALDAGERLPRSAALDKGLTQLKRTEERAWLAEVSSVPLQQALRDLDSAWSNCFAKRARRPRFRRRVDRQSARYTRRGFSLRGRELRLAKMAEPLEMRWSRALPSEPTSCTVILDRAGRYFVSFVVEVEPEPLPEVNVSVGVDLGLTHFLVTSEGRKEARCNFLKRDLERLARAQRKLKRKKKCSRNRAKASRRVARIRARIADKRRDRLHKLSTRLVRENQAVAVEDLNVSGMVRNRCLARSISDAGWGMFVRMLAYKCAWYGRVFIKVDRWLPSSKTCSGCGHVVGRMPLSVREWECPRCGEAHDRDVNAARNVKNAAGLAVRACGEGVSMQGGQLRLFAARKPPRGSRKSSA